MKKSKGTPKTQPPAIPVLDLHLSAFQHLYGNTPALDLQGGRVVFLFCADDVFYRLAAQFNRNESIPVLDFVNAQRQLRAMMLSKKAGAASNETSGGGGKTEATFQKNSSAGA